VTAAGHDAFAAWQACDVRVGTIVRAEPFPEGRTSSHVLWIDCGPELGTRKSLARLVPHYGTAELIGRQVLCLVSLAPRQIGGHLSEVLTLGVPDASGAIALVVPDREVPSGGRLH